MTSTTKTATTREQRCLKCGRTAVEVHRLHYLGGQPTGCSHQWSDTQPPEPDAGLRDDEYKCDACDKVISEEDCRGGIRGGGEGTFCPECCGEQSDAGQSSREAETPQTSELPWTLGQNGDNCAKNHAICSGASVIAKVYGLGFPIGSGWSPRSEADARLIVTAVNSYESLIAALELAQKFLLLLTDAGVLDQIAAELSSPDEVNALCDQIDEALKHAREGE